MAKLRYNELKTLHSRIGEILEEYETNRDAEKAAAGQDDGGQRIERTDRPAGMDAAPGVSPLDTRTGRKLTARGDSPAARALYNMPGFNRLSR